MLWRFCFLINDWFWFWGDNRRFDSILILISLQTTDCSDYAAHVANTGEWRHLSGGQMSQAPSFVEAPSTPATMSKQQCWMLEVKWLFWQSQMMLQHCWGQQFCSLWQTTTFKNVQHNFILSTKSNQTEHVQFVSTLLKGRNFTKYSFSIVAKNGNITSWLSDSWHKQE